jgi:hypothetical protein
MDPKPRSRIVLIDDAHHGATAKILAAAVADSQYSAQRTFETVTRQQARRSWMLDRDAVVFVSISARKLSFRGDNTGEQRTNFEAWAIAQWLARSESRVILVSEAGTSPFTGVDTAAAMLAGMAGVVDDRLLIAGGVFDLVIDQNHVGRRERTMLLLGEPAAQLKNIKNVLDEWESTDDEGDDAGCFRVAMALAQLDQLRPLCGSGESTSFVKLARALNMAAPKTSFRLSEGDLRKLLSRLANRLIGPDHEHRERIRLPDYVRKCGFSPCPLMIDGIPEKESAKRLYKATSAIALELRGSAHETNLWAARLPFREFRHLTASRPKE